MKQREKQEQAELFSADFQSFFTVASVAQKTRQGNDGKPGTKVEVPKSLTSASQRIFSAEFQLCKNMCLQSLNPKGKKREGLQAQLAMIRKIHTTTQEFAAI